MKHIVLLHTAQSMFLSFEKRLREALSVEVKIDTILDTFLSNNPNEILEFSTNNLNRLYLTLKSAEMTGADMIVIVCSTLSPHVKVLESFFKIPLVTIDCQLGQEAIKYGDDIMVLTSAQSAAQPTADILYHAAAEHDRTLNIDMKYNLEAFHAMMRGDMQTHDDLMISTSGDISNKNVIVLGQGSLEHLAQRVAVASGLPVVSSPALCIQVIKKIIESS